LPHTPNAVLEEARLLALELGVHYVYVGNVHTKEGNNTYCPICRALLIARTWHTVQAINLDEDSCPRCGHKLPLVLAARTQRPARSSPRAEAFA
jgi:pyruvate formate lyase activating enzyme